MLEDIELKKWLPTLQMWGQGRGGTTILKIDLMMVKMAPIDIFLSLSPYLVPL